LTKQNLVIVLTPYIIDSEDDIRRITDQKLDERKQFLEVFGKFDEEYMAQVNFQKKHGMLEEIHQKIRKAQDDEEVRQRAYGDEKPKNKPAEPAKGEEAPTPPAEAPKDGDIIIVPEP
jgi:hypothetical protein